jgi:hypothetical protein
LGILLTKLSMTLNFMLVLPLKLRKKKCIWCAYLNNLKGKERTLLLIFFFFFFFFKKEEEEEEEVKVLLFLCTAITNITNL